MIERRKRLGQQPSHVTWGSARYIRLDLNSNTMKLSRLGFEEGEDGVEVRLLGLSILPLRVLLACGYATH
jgi:hypothetical protein